MKGEWRETETDRGLEMDGGQTDGEWEGERERERERERVVVGCLMSQQHASVSQGRVCSDICLRAATLS